MVKYLKKDENVESPECTSQLGDDTDDTDDDIDGESIYNLTGEVFSNCIEDVMQNTEFEWINIYCSEWNDVFKILWYHIVTWIEWNI